MNPIFEKNSNIYLISFPKSGTAWLKNIVLNILEREGSLDKHRHINEIIPAVNRFDTLPRLFYMDDPMTYHAYLRTSKFPEFSKRIYISRNPVDVFNSSYKFFPILRNLTRAQALNFFIKGKAVVDNWKEHLQDAKSQRNVCFVSYEGLSKDFDSEISKIASYLGVEMNDSKLSKIKKNCSFESMKADKERHEHDRNMGEHFRVGKANEYTDQDFEGELAPLKEWYDYYKSLE